MKFNIITAALIMTMISVGCAPQKRTPNPGTYKSSNDLAGKTGPNGLPVGGSGGAGGANGNGPVISADDVRKQAFEVDDIQDIQVRWGVETQSADRASVVQITFTVNGGNFTIYGKAANNNVQDRQMNNRAIVQDGDPVKYAIVTCQDPAARGDQGMAGCNIVTASLRAMGKNGQEYNLVLTTTKKIVVAVRETSGQIQKFGSAEYVTNKVSGNGRQKDFVAATIVADGAQQGQALVVATRDRATKVQVVGLNQAASNTELAVENPGNGALARFVINVMSDGNRTMEPVVLVLYENPNAIPAMAPGGQPDQQLGPVQQQGQPLPGPDQNQLGPVAPQGNVQLPPPLPGAGNPVQGNPPGNPAIQQGPGVQQPPGNPNGGTAAEEDARNTSGSRSDDSGITMT